MVDFLDRLAKDAIETVESGYYSFSETSDLPSVSLKKAIVERRNAAIIAEIKAASPSAGVIKNSIDAGKVAKDIEQGGAVGISVLTEPKHFKGSVFSLSQARKASKLPILMKDIIIDPIQVEAAKKIGADVILLIEALFERGYTNLNISDFISKAHANGLEVLLETHSKEEFDRAMTTDADMIGINNRDLSTLKVDLKVTERILEETSSENRIIVSESGIRTQGDVRFLHDCGAHAFLIGSSIMASKNIKEKVKEFTLSL